MPSILGLSNYYIVYHDEALRQDESYVRFPVANLFSAQKAFQPNLFMFQRDDFLLTHNDFFRAFFKWDYFEKAFYEQMRKQSE